MTKHIQVAVAVVMNPQDEIFISRRSATQHQGNKWEFPGGKVEPNEAVEAALQREIQEELGITIQTYTHLLDITHEYPAEAHSAAKTVTLHVYTVTQWQGEPRGAEGQTTCWVKRQALAELEFPIANRAIIARLLSSV